MKSVQRKFGGMMKRSADDADAAGVMAEFKSVEGMLDTVSQLQGFAMPLSDC